MKSGASALDLLQDVGGFSGPDEWLGVFVVMIDVVEHGADQFLHAAKGCAAQAILRQVAEEAFYHVQPRTAGRREVHMEAGMAAEPAFHLGMLVGGIVVDDQIGRASCRDSESATVEAS